MLNGRSEQSQLIGVRLQTNGKAIMLFVLKMGAIMIAKGMA